MNSIRIIITKIDSDLSYINAPLSEVEFRIKEEAVDEQCRFIPELRYRKFWFLWSKWQCVQAGEMTVRIGRGCLARHCSMSSAQGSIASIKTIFSKYQRKNSSIPINHKVW